MAPTSATKPAKKISVQSLLTSQIALCNLPVLILVLVASLDNADKQLLASSFPLLERTLGLGVDTLGYFSLFTNLSYSLSLPFWGWLVHRYGMRRIHVVLSAACASWGAATVGIALSGRSVAGQAAFRAVNGFALGSILPLSQTLLVGMVPASMRGRAFGYMGMCEKLAGTLAAAGVIYFDNWQRSYYALGGVSLCFAVVARRELTPGKRAQARARAPGSGAAKESGSDGEHDDNEGDGLTAGEPKLTVRQILTRIAKIPAFLCLVAQGIFGGTPWEMMSFILLLLDWRQFTKEQIVAMQFSMGITATIGGWIGGMVGDYAASRRATKGRIYTALASIVLGIPIYGAFLYATDYRLALLYINLFHLVATWSPAAALRPICADLARNPSERAQIVSLWIVMEKTAGAIFGAPLVGYLTRNMIQMKEGGEGGAGGPEDAAMKAGALAWNMFGLSTFFWGMCSVFWVGMAYTIDGNTTTKDLQLEMHQKKSNVIYKEDTTPLV